MFYKKGGLQGASLRCIYSIRPALKYNTFDKAETFKLNKWFSFVFENPSIIYSAHDIQREETFKKELWLDSFSFCYIVYMCSVDDKASKDNKSLIITCFYCVTARYFKRRLKA